MLTLYRFNGNVGDEWCREGERPYDVFVRIGGRGGDYGATGLIGVGGVSWGQIFSFGFGSRPSRSGHILLFI